MSVLEKNAWLSFREVVKHIIGETYRDELHKYSQENIRQHKTIKVQHEYKDSFYIFSNGLLLRNPCRCELGAR